MDVKFTEILFSKNHLFNPFEIEEKGLSISDKKTKVIAFSILFGILIPVVGGIACFYVFSASYKVKKLSIEQDLSSLENASESKPLRNATQARSNEEIGDDIDQLNENVIDQWQLAANEIRTGLCTRQLLRAPDEMLRIMQKLHPSFSLIPDNIQPEIRKLWAIKTRNETPDVSALRYASIGSGKLLQDFLNAVLILESKKTITRIEMMFSDYSYGTDRYGGELIDWEEITELKEIFKYVLEEVFSERHLEVNITLINPYERQLDDDYRFDILSAIRIPLHNEEEISELKKFYNDHRSDNAGYFIVDDNSRQIKDFG